MSCEPIGGFFPLEPPSTGDGMLITWVGSRPAATFGNARSALAALIAAERPAQVWLPAYLCASVAEAAPEPLRRYYPVGAGLAPDLVALAAAEQGDMVLAIDYFGRRPDAAFMDFVRARNDLLFVEDCAHYLAPCGEGWGDWRLFSPRKLIGVADGGVLIGAQNSRRVPRASQPARTPEIQWQAALMRFECGSAESSTQWHPVNQAHETSMAVSGTGMSRLSRWILDHVAAEPLIVRRRENYARLADSLDKFQLPLDLHSGDVPFAFPVRLERGRRDAVLQRLHAQGVFAAVHWRHLPSPPDAFPTEHQLAEELISLPCDHRYGAAEMDRVAHVFLAAVQ